MNKLKNNSSPLIADEMLVQEHLSEFARNFILLEKKDRYCTLVLSERGIKKWRSELDHFQKFLQMELTTEILAVQRTVGGICQMLNIKNAEPSNAVVFSTNDRLSLGVGSLKEILADVIATDIGAIISVVPGSLAIYWGEERHAKYILRAARRLG